MRRHLLAATALTTTVLFLVPGAAIAQTTPYDWSGFYAGVTAGLSQSRTSFDFDYSDTYDSPDSLLVPGLGPSGGIVGGVNFQNGNFVFGIEADGSLMQINGRYGSTRTSTAPGVDINTQLNALLDLRGRLGLANGPLLLFATAGVAVGHEHFQSTIFDTDGDSSSVSTARGDGVVVGPSVGLGMEYALTDKVSLTAEGTFTSFGALTASGDNGKGTYDTTSHMVVAGAKAGVNFHF